MLGITGGVGSGKSTVLDILKNDYGAFIISCDEVARGLQKRGGKCFADIVALFGEQILRPDGEPDRSRIADLVFADPELLGRLEQIVHPAVKREIQSMAENAGNGLIVIESALLLLAGYDTVCRKIWYVYASEIVRRARLRSSRGYTDERISRMFAAQESEDWYRSRADYVIDNDSAGFDGLKIQIEKGLRENGVLHYSQRQQR